MRIIIHKLNPGADFKPVVLVNLSQHGDPLYFAVTAVAGCLAVIGLARLTPRWGLIQATGRYTLIFLGLNEIYFDSVNRSLARFLEIPPSTPQILFWCTLVTVVSMVACVPLIWLFDRYVPRLVGRPREKGPLLPNLV